MTEKTESGWRNWIVRLTDDVERGLGIPMGIATLSMRSIVAPMWVGSKISIRCAYC